MNSLLLVSFLDTDVVVSPSNVYLGEEFGSFQFIDEGGNEQERICILDGVFIEILIILERAKPLLDKEERKDLRGLRFSNLARFEMLINELLTCLHFFWVERVCLGHFQLKVSFKSMA